MSLDARAALPPAPPSVATPEGTPRFGTYHGELGRVDLERLQGPWRLTPAARLLRRKRWAFAFVATHEVACACAVVDLGWAASAFALAVDLQARAPLGDVSFLGPPRPPLAQVGDCPGPGLGASLRTLGGRVAVRRGEQEERYRVEASVWPGRSGGRHRLRWGAELLAAGGPPALTVIAPGEQEGQLDVTQKWSGLLTLGVLEAGGRRWTLDGGVGGLDYSQGLLPRHTTWRWAFAAGRLADGTPVGLNLVEGFNEASPHANENALWVGGELHPLARARFSYRPDELYDPWHLSTVDGALELRFRPLWVHREERELRWVSSRFAQVVGLFDGSVRVGGRTLALEALPGVTERQDARW